MMKRIGVTGLIVAAVLGLNGLVASSASAQVYGCYKISEFKLTAPKKGGTWKNSACTERAAQLEGEYVLVLLTQFKVDNLWCAEIKNIGAESEDGYYTNNKCETKLPEGEKNKSNFTEVIVPFECRKISEFKAKVKGGTYTEAGCKVLAAILEGEYVLVKLLGFVRETLWCAELNLNIKTENAEDGYYTNNKCETKLPEVEKNKSDFTEVVVPAGRLPDVSVTLGSYPLHLNYLSNTVKTKVENTSGSILSGEGWHLLYLTGELTALGTFRAIFLKYVKGTEKCFNQGEEANGEVLVEGSFHIVYTSLAGSTQGLQIGVLYLIKELNGTTGIKCKTSGIEIKVRGSVIGSINVGSTGEGERIGQKSVLTGTSGKQAIRAYWNDAGTGLLAQLLSSLGAGFLETNLVIEGEPEVTALNGAMYQITGI
ncbi:MAG TPA: hypothetical protein VK680_09280 [Solirubrobacteraceae bacterium]|jgi:hypothetical protein|nr:hypothetical protein [Solirubrobacteraceae bacterium]